MKLQTIFALTVSASLLAACGSGGSGGVSGREKNRFVEACLAETNMERPLCECVANTAADELTPNGFRMLLASVEGNDADATRARGQMSMDEITQAGMFMVSAPARCAAGNSGQ